MDERYYRFVGERYHCNGNIVRSEKMESNLVSLIAVEVLTSARFNRADVDGEFKEVGHTTHCCFRDTLKWRRTRLSEIDNEPAILV
jgi:hypothetical protein